MDHVDTVRSQLEDKLTSQFGSLQKDLSSRIDRVTAELKTVAAKVQEVEARVDNLQGDVKVISAKQDTLSTTLTSRITALDEGQKSYADAVKVLTRRVARLEDERRTSEVVLSGVPQQASEDLRRLAIRTAAAVGVTLAPENIARVSRMRGVEDPERSRLIHLALASRESRDALLRGKRSKGRLLASEIDPVFSARPVYMNEYLQRDAHELLRAVRTEARSRGYRFVWPRAGSIYVKKDSDSQIIQIQNRVEITLKLA